MNAVVVLTRGYSDKSKYKDLINRNRSLEQFYNDNISYLIFHEGNINEDHQNYIQSNARIPLKFINVKDSFKEKTMKFSKQTTRSIPSCSIGYRNMCNFWICGFWKYVEEYDKILRIDEDCIYKTDYNEVFDVLNDKVCTYGIWKRDAQEWCIGMNRFVVNYLNNNGMNVQNRTPKNGPYTNVVGFNLKLLRQNQLLKDFLTALEESNNIYFHRWGDLPLWGQILIYMYTTDDHIRYRNIKYYHGSHKRQIN